MSIFAILYVIWYKNSYSESNQKSIIIKKGKVLKMDKDKFKLDHSSSMNISIRISILGILVFASCFFVYEHPALFLTLSVIGIILLIISFVILVVYFRCPHCKRLLAAKSHICRKCNKKIDW